MHLQLLGKHVVKTKWLKFMSTGGMLECLEDLGHIDLRPQPNRTKEQPERSHLEEHDLNGSYTKAGGGGNKSLLVILFPTRGERVLLCTGRGIRTNTFQSQV